MRRSRPAVRLPVAHPRRVLAVGAVLVLAAGPVALAPAPTPTTVAPSPGPEDRGTQLYLEHCASCHGERGQGAQRGPSLVGVGAASVDFQLSTGRMPLSREVPQVGRGEPVFSAADVAALVDHVATFGGGGPPVPRVAPGDPVPGRELFAANCAPCHGSTGAGGALTNGWTAPPLYDATPTQVAEAVRVGPGLMPVFPTQVLSDAQVNDLTSYVQRLRGARLDRGGNPLGRLGPLAEGLVAWLVVLGLLVAAVRWLGRKAGE
ncbi:c-type cytochrome [Micromonospora soli]|uniref:cytochrome bc1 complex diheme cytochrome c subunit n=1 Tax=Micromonospora sp. NBRC 110009 TaxID=3061627 RepID=UPI0026710206|nr:c-type cytochrome [Micromonospora sp. NBRC 110009]WKT97365.1 c-type cytochrome [Micromonospora sp. NBRC 110009]